MKFWKRAGLYLRRKKGRSILLGLLLFLMSCFVIVGLSFKESAEREADSLRRSLATGFVLEVDFSNEMYQEYRQTHSNSGVRVYVGPTVTDEMIEKILSMDGVTDYVANLFTYVYTELQLRPGAWAVEEPDAERKPGMLTFIEEDLMYLRHETLIWPCRKGEIHKNFRTGALTISEGRNIEEGDRYKAVISEWMAEENGLLVGDTFTIGLKEGMYSSNSENPMKTMGEPLELEIVGLFHTNFEQQASEYTFEHEYVDNVIYTDMDTYEGLVEIDEMYGYEEAEGYGRVEFLVEDPESVDSIMQQIKDAEDIDLENIKLTVDNSAYEASVKPYNQIRVFAVILLAVGLGGVGIILYLVLRLWVQGRRHEMGILLSVGISKGKILCQMLAECLLVSAVALLLSFMLSGVLIGRCTAMAEHMTAPRADVESYRVTSEYGSGQPVITKNFSDEVVLNREVSVKTMFFVALFVFGISGISVCLSFTQISSIEPEKLFNYHI